MVTAKFSRKIACRKYGMNIGKAWSRKKSCELETEGNLQIGKRVSAGG